MFESYYFVKELHEEIVFINPIVCQLSNFLRSIEKNFYDNKNFFEEVQKVFFLYCSKKNNQRIFYSIFQWFMKRDQVVSLVRQLKKIREHQRKEIKR